MNLLHALFALSMMTIAPTIEDIPSFYFSKLSGVELVKEFERAGLALKDSYDVPTNESSRLANPIHGPRYPHYARVRMALVRRGKPVVPALLKFLEAERILDRGKDARGNTITFVVEVTRVLERIGDPQAVDHIVSILEDLRLTAHCKAVAYYALTRLTYVGFHEFGLEYGYHRDCVQHPTVKPTDDYNNYQRLAQCYRNWLASEGKDRSRWLGLARQQARAQLAGKNLKLAYQAVSFLSHRNGERDDQPDATLKRLEALVVDFRFSPSERPITDYKAYNMLHDSRQWLHFLQHYGLHAQPYVKSYLKLLKENEVNHWSTYEFLGRIGGKDAVTYAIEKLPVIEAEVNRLNSDPNLPKGFRSDDPRGWWFDSHRTAQRLFDRWVGRAFVDNTERMKWWAENKSKSPETWLNENLDTVAQQADEGNAMARFIMTMLLPDMPFHRHVIKGESIMSGEGFAVDQVAISVHGNPHVPHGKSNKYSKWLSSHRSSLRYEARVGGFILLKSETKN